MNACLDCVHCIPKHPHSPYLDRCDLVRDPVGRPYDCLLARMTFVGECGPQARYFLGQACSKAIMVATMAKAGDGMTRYAKRVDQNQPAIVKALRERGVKVYVASAAGKGMTDLVCFYRGLTVLAEVKDGAKSPSRQGLTLDQIELHELAATAGVGIPIFNSVDSAITYFGFAQ